jgi:hypothetical protein
VLLAGGEAVMLSLLVQVVRLQGALVWRLVGVVEERRDRKFLLLELSSFECGLQLGLGDFGSGRSRRLVEFVV